ncbi:putative DNA-binding domain-containing protein [Sphingomonas sp. ST-64]|uniref:DNA-binding domain-containing protein n=1 Tax=Sphingomonas plantiphila TaxID=3163295 RepID=A0ABW8YKH1_9SPHN
MTLLAMQRDMRAWLTAESETAAANLGADAAPGLRIHLNNYRAQLIACLAESFERTRDWIGGAAFEAAAATHIDRVPPSAWTLDAYPRDFPATLSDLYPADPEVAELAWLECALGEAFVAPDAATITPADITAVDWDSAVLSFTPTLDLGALTSNAPAIWSALSEGAVPPAAECLTEPGALLVWRQGQLSRFRAIDQLEMQALLHARGGMAFAGLCEQLVLALGEAEGVARAGAYLGTWIADGLIADASD